MRLYTPHELAYPITVTKLLKNEGDKIEANEALFVYTYTATVTEYDRDVREDVEKKRTWPANFESELEGTLSLLNVTVGQVIQRRAPVAEVEEACRHEIQYGGICANCGADMTQNHYNTSVVGTSRATVNTVHGHTDLLISTAEATKADEEAKRRLLDSRKLSLVVDLDQTVIHAAVEPTIGEWQNDPTNPNHEAVRDVRKFQLVDEGPGGRGTWYYIKLRPGLQEFLETIAKYYELHIYTMGTRAYAEHIARIIDPTRALFGDRILSRDENGSMTAKNLKRLFPVDTKMVVIIDDRADVWNWSPNLIKVSVYNFFVGIGDINSSFLPKQPTLELRPSKAAKAEKEAVAAEAAANGAATAKEIDSIVDEATAGGSTAAGMPGSDLSAVDQMVSMAGMQDAGSLQEKLEAQAQTIEAQVEDRPLLQQQLKLEAQEEAEAKASPAVEAATADLLSPEEKNGDHNDDPDASPSDSQQSQPPKAKSILRDDDVELEHLGRSLREVHTAYFNEYDRRTLGAKGGRVAELRPGAAKHKRSFDDLDHIPDAAVVVQSLKARVLAGVQLVFTGIFSLGTDLHKQEVVLQAQAFGATIAEKVTSRTTHVIASPERRTTKVRQALARGANGGKVKVVELGWLASCFQEWRKVPEGPFLIHQEDSATAGVGLIGSDAEISTSDDDGGNADANGSLAALHIDTAAATETDTDEDLEQYRPTSERQDSSPTVTEQAEDWGDIDDELAEFLGSEAEDDTEDDDEEIASDAESVSSAAPATSSSSSAKRSRATAGLETDSEGESENSLPSRQKSTSGLSRLQKRKKEALSRTSSLTNMAIPPASSSPTKDAVGGDPGGSAPVAGAKEEIDDDEDLEAMLAAEMERQSDEEE